MRINYLYEVKLEGVWTDITSDVTGIVSSNLGMMSNSFSDRVASTGKMRLTLINTSGNYTPSLINPFSISTPFRFSIDNTIKFTGYIKKIKIINRFFVEVNIVDVFDILNSYPVTLVESQNNLNIYQATQYLINLLPAEFRPEVVYKGGAIDVFPTVFDTGNSKTKIGSELTKLALSEEGYIYLKSDGKLVVEGRQDRLIDPYIKSVPLDAEVSSLILLENLEDLITESGESIVADESKLIEFSTTTNIKVLDLDFGNDLINSVSLTSYPRKIDSTDEILWKSSAPIKLSAGEYKTIKSNYIDFTYSSQKINAKSITTPVQGVDYIAWDTLTEGVGNNRSSYVSISSYSFGSSDFEITFHNGFNRAVYLTTVYIKGIGIYTYDTFTFNKDDNTSIDTYGLAELTISQKYQSSAETVINMSTNIIEKYKYPKVNVNSVELIASEPDLLKAFLLYDIGDLVHLVSVKDDIDDYFFINSLEFNINENLTLTFKWYLVDALDLSTNYFTVDEDELDDDSVLIGY